MNESETAVATTPKSLDPAARCSICGAELRPGEVLHADANGTPIMRAWHCTANAGHPVVEQVEDADWHIEVEGGWVLQPGWQWQLGLLVLISIAAGGWAWWRLGPRFGFLTWSGCLIGTMAFRVWPRPWGAIIGIALFASSVLLSWLWLP